MDKSTQRMKKQLNFLMGYVIITSTVFAFFLFSSFNQEEKTLKLDELTLKKLNLIGEDGSLRLVISNESR